MNIAEIAFATTTGLVAGAVFALVDAPIPAPPALAGVMGIVGIYLGYKLVEHFDLVGAIANAIPL
ncbi:XapX domain-containing protein [Halorubellus sp. JP-L1]|uniref:XapX domain-containing protein n=1 Tax=Halorubellus sp. JP-L1 TaxID=2715753 RepID=UPI001407417A|nr:XapX domain-containing protein [Halorubellus sp. JP-L1]NHN40173.1 XapX domain-containing protein [Halorubellus sp. JP-L1]